MVEGVFCEQGLVDYFRNSIKGNYKQFRLACERYICYQRDKSAGRQFVCGEEEIDKVFDFYERHAVDNLEEVIVDNSSLSVDGVVDIVISNLTSFKNKTSTVPSISLS